MGAHEGITMSQGSGKAKCELDDCTADACGSVCPSFLRVTRWFFVCYDHAQHHGYAPRPLTANEMATGRPDP